MRYLRELQTNMKSVLCLPRAVMLGTLLFFAAGCAFAADTVVEEIVARVNNAIITRSDLRRSREQMLNEARQQGISESDPRVQQNEKNLLRDLIDQQLLLQRGQDLGITADTDLVKRLDEIRKQMNLDSMEAVEKAAREQGISFEDFKQNLRNQLITQQVIQREVGGKIQVTQEEQKQYYEQHKAELSQPEQVQLSEIMVTPASDKPEALSAAQQKAQQALAEIKSGKSFETAAKEFSNGPTASQGGDLGLFRRGTLARELEDKVFAMQAGEITDVIRTKQGYIILKVTNHQQAGTPDLKTLEPRIQEVVYMQKLQPALREYLTRLREQAFVEVRTGYVDTAASPNQTNPMLVAQSSPTASSAPQKSEPKKKKKFGVF
jgi:peptidyl-prolyl cis-trans isomerase SurA